MKYEEYVKKCEKEGVAPAPKSARLCYMTMDEYYEDSKREFIKDKVNFKPVPTRDKYHSIQLGYHLNLGSESFGCGKKTCDLTHVAVKIAV